MGVTEKLWSTENGRRKTGKDSKEALGEPVEMARMLNGDDSTEDAAADLQAQLDLS